MFAKPRTRHTIAPPSKKRKLVSAVEEVTFDATAREDYLNGFHKRKLQRIKHANEEAAKRERNEKLAARKLVCRICANKIPLGFNNKALSYEKAGKQILKSTLKQ